MKIRHVAMFSSDHDKLAEFYTQVMGLEEVSRGGSPPGNTIYLTDGYINVAIIGSKNGESQPPGVNHIGFKVDDLEQAKDMLRSQQGDLKVDEQPGLALHGQYFEAKFKDPEGFVFDVSQSGWPGQQ